MLKAFFLLVLGAFLFMISSLGDSVPEKEFPIYYHSTAQEEQGGAVDAEKIKISFNLLRQACPTLFLKSGDDVKSADARSALPMPYQTEQKGWQTMIEVKIVLKDRLNTISKGYNANGHTLYYYIGKGGVFTDKRLAQQICGWPVSESSDAMFREIKGM